ncbi:MAG: hypothetical protein Q9168_005812 [Polycauliona sp. 1 TL-2023]
MERRGGPMRDIQEEQGIPLQELAPMTAQPESLPATQDFVMEVMEPETRKPVLEKPAQKEDQGLAGAVPRFLQSVWRSDFVWEACVPNPHCEVHKEARQRSALARETTAEIRRQKAERLANLRPSCPVTSSLGRKREQSRSRRNTRRKSAEDAVAAPAHSAVGIPETEGDVAPVADVRISAGPVAAVGVGGGEMNAEAEVSKHATMDSGYYSSRGSGQEKWDARKEASAASSSSSYSQATSSEQPAVGVVGIAY